jgi:hypothetical protein
MTTKQNQDSNLSGSNKELLKQTFRSFIAGKDSDATLQFSAYLEAKTHAQVEKMLEKA